MADFGVEMKLMSAEDGAAIVAHPDVILHYHEMWTCSCGGTMVAFGPLIVMGKEQPARTWCGRCGDVAEWRGQADADAD